MTILTRVLEAVIRPLAKVVPQRFQAWVLDLCCRFIQRGTFGRQLSITYRGWRVFLDRNDWGGAQIRLSFALHGHWHHELFEQRVVDSLLDGSSRWIVVDAGANYGMYSLLAAAHPMVTKVVAVEASPTTCEYLRRTVSYNGLSAHIEVLNAGVSSSSGVPLKVVHLRSSEWNKVAAVAEGEEAVDRIESVSVDDILTRLGVSAGTQVFVKMDIEGHEPVAFTGMCNLFDGQVPYAVLFEFHVGLLGASSSGFADYIFSIPSVNVYLLDVARQRAQLLDREAMDGHIQAASRARHPFNLFDLLIISNRIAWRAPMG